MRTLILALIFICTAFSAVGQSRWKQLVSQSQSQWYLGAIKKANPQMTSEDNCPPDLKTSVPESTAFDTALHPYEIDPAVEAISIERLFANDCAVLEDLRLLSDLYFPLFERQLEANKLEEDFKFLPLVLSALNTSYSDGHNKAGLWALDLPRAKKSGLQIDQFVDERMAPSAATNAAMSLLKSYKERYDGDLLKMIVAMMRGVNFADSFTPEQKMDNELTFELTALHVCLRLFKNTESTNHLMGWLTYLNEYQSIAFKKPFHWEALSLIPSVNLTTLRGINTCYIGDSIPGLFRGVPFLLHKSSMDEFKSLEDSIYNYTPPVKEIKKAVKPLLPEGEAITYLVRSGDVLGTIAEKHSVRVSELKRWNGIRGDNINIGQKLMIYGNAKAPVQTPSTMPAATIQRKGDYDEYTVKSGDSLWLIAKQFSGVSAENIMEWNNVSNDIRPGQKLKIYKTK